MTSGRIAQEKAAVGKMVAIYCRGKGYGKTLCTDCAVLLRYVEPRLDSCILGEKKPFC